MWFRIRPSRSGSEVAPPSSAASAADGFLRLLPDRLGGNFISAGVAEVAASALRRSVRPIPSGQDPLGGDASGTCGCRCDPLCAARRQAASDALIPTDYQLAVASYYAGVKSVKRRAAAVPDGAFPLTEVCGVEDRVTGLRVVLFVGPEQLLPECSCKHSSSCHHSGALCLSEERTAVAVLAFRGTRATHRGNLAADIGILRHNTRRAELRIAEEARAVVEGFTAQLEVGTPGVKYVWVATGHSLGGFLATTVTICFPHIHRCVTFESPGCPKFYRDMAAKRAGEYDNYWKERITNYLTLPNPINMSHPHVGCVMRIDLTDFMSNLGGGHVIKCLAGSLFRWINWVCLLVVAFLACELLVGLSFGSALVRMCSIIDQLQSWLHIFVGQHVNSIVPSLCLVGIGEAVTLWHVTSAASLSFKGTTALVATRLGANLPFQLAAHKLSNILSAFSPETGKPKSCVEMVSWPHAACFKRSVSRDLRIYLWECFFPTATAESVRHIFNRRRLIANRMSRLPGYEEMASSSAEGC